MSTRLRFYNRDGPGGDRVRDLGRGRSTHPGCMCGWRETKEAEEREEEEAEDDHDATVVVRG